MQLFSGRPGHQSLLFWCYTPDTPLTDWHWQLDGEPLEPGRLAIQSLEALFGPVARGCHLLRLAGLEPDRSYHLSARSGTHDVSQTARTLPQHLGSPFSLAVTSCFYHRDADQRYALAPQPPGVAPQLQINLGDQLYLDYDWKLGLPQVLRAPDVQARYQQQWQHPNFQAWFGRAPNLCFPDDHDFWNNYPHGNWYLRLWAETAPGGAEDQRLRQAFFAFQGGLNLDPDRWQQHAPNADTIAAACGRARLELGDASLFVLDERLNRTRFDLADAHFSAPADLDAAVNWLAQLTSPGVLFLSQPLVMDARPKRGWQRLFSLDLNLPDYPADYRRLLDALFAAPHEVLIVAGDIHLNRLLALQRGSRTVFEATSSPIARFPFKTPKPKADHGTLPVCNDIHWHTVVPAMRPSHSQLILQLQRQPEGLAVELAWYSCDEQGQYQRDATHQLLLR